MSHSPAPDAFGWWASLNHGGMLIAPSRLASAFSEGADALPEWSANRLRRDVLRARKGNTESASALLDTLLEDIVGLDAKQWVKGAGVPKEQACKSNTGETLKPARLWRGDHGASLAVFYPEQASGGLSVSAGYRLGIGRGRRAVVRVVEWLRKTGQQVALLATYRQLRLIHAGADYEAFCEWDADLWFHEGAPGLQVQALRLLLSTNALTPKESGRESPLVGAINDSRRGQSELSAALGERVRRAVEELIQASGPRLLPLMDDGPRRVEERDIYLAATRMIMRCVVILFAEARELLPQTHPIYAQSYGLNALRVELERHSAERLRTGYGAWPRLVGLFSLMFNGSEHEALPLLRYGGGLFEPGNAQSKDAVMRSIAAFEQAEIRDADVQHILELITRCPTRVPQGKGWSTVQTPVDFSALGSEYLGILYEGLLDYELKRVGEGEAVIFLGIGSEPALPFALLDGMSNADLADLLKKLGKATRAEAEEDEGEDAAADSDDGRSEHTEDEEEGVTGLEAETLDSRGELRDAVQAWAERAVKAAKLVPVPSRGQQARHREAYELKVSQRARTLVRGLFLPGDWYLVRWGGTRKGAGTFYTRPQLVVPIVQRTLAPLCFEPAVAGQAPRPRKPEEILALKVCDPAMGSGSFLVAALRYLTSALLQSLYAHERLSHHGARWYIRLADGLPLDDPKQESLPAPKDDSNLDDLLRARLKRHVVERCLYGVDVDALAVELARTALWLETIDYQLPFGFLDHKLKCGNSLVGAWLDGFEEYPILAWDRQGGDAKHATPVHHVRMDNGKPKGDVWTAAIKKHRDQTIRPLFRSETSRRETLAAGQMLLRFESQGKDARTLHSEAFACFEQLHNIIPIFEAERRAQVYRSHVLENSALSALREALDTWCAVWFWPGDRLDLAPTPRDLLSPRAETRAEVTRIARAVNFFHWELEFPDVFGVGRPGFDAILMNPPWETVERKTTEFFTNVDPLYRTYAKEDTVAVEKGLFKELPGCESTWVAHCARIDGFVNWYSNSGASASARSPRPFIHQGEGKPYTFRLFIELAISLCHDLGTLGAVVPSAVFSDKGSTEIRRVLLDQCDWQTLVDFENSEKIFNIHRSARFAVITIAKGHPTERLQTAFMRRSLGFLQQALSTGTGLYSYPAQLIRNASPDSLIISEMTSQESVAAVTCAHSNGVPFSSPEEHGWRVRYSREFNMSDDAGRFRPVSHFDSQGFTGGKLGFLWRKKEVAVPFLEGRCVDAFQCFAMRWISGRGRQAKWIEQDIGALETGAQFYMPPDEFVESRQFRKGCKIAVMDVTGVTNARSVIASCAPPIPSGHSINVASTGLSDPLSTAALCGVLNSFVFDYLVRLRLTGQHVTEFFLRDVPLPVPSGSWVRWLGRAVMRLNCGHPLFSSWWQEASTLADDIPRDFRRRALTQGERMRLRANVDAVVASAYGLDEGAFRLVLRECDFPVATLTGAFCRKLEPKGFWRTDRRQNPELRQSVLSLIAFRHLNECGLAGFMSLNDGDGWQLPETVRLADYDLGRDARAKEHQPVAAALGERFLPWQLREDAGASWDECQRHAELIERIVPSKTRSMPPPSTLTPLTKAVPRATQARPLVKALPAKRQRVKQKA